MRALLIVFLAATPAPGQYVPPVPTGLRGDTVVEYRGPIPLPSPQTRWIRVRSARFNVVSTASEKRAREVASTLETLASALGSVHPRFRPKAIETRVLLFARRSESQPYFDFLLKQASARTPGMFVTSEDGSATMVIDSGSRWRDRTVVHELMHNLLAASGANLPLWLEEGIAEYFSTAQVSRGAVHVGRPIREHEVSIRRRVNRPIARLFAAKTTDYRLYADSWAVVDWMMRTDDESFYRLVADVERGVAAETALQEHFRITTPVLERLIRNPGMRAMRTFSIAVEEPRLQSEVETLSYSDALSELATFLGSMELGRQDAHRHLDAAAPGHARALATRGVIRSYEKNYPESYRLFEQALAADPGDASIALDYAEALLQSSFGPFAGVMEPAVDAPERFRRARQLVRGAAPPWRADAIAGSAYLVEADVTPGIELLQRALAQRPARMDVALNLYTLLLRGGRNDEAQRLFEDTFANSRQAQTTLAARAVYVRERLTVANRYLDQHNTDEGLKIVRELIEVTPDPAARRELEVQLARIESAAQANREITAYNTAVDATNRGDYEEALALVRSLISTAGDEKVLRDAARLRDELDRRIRGMRR